MQDLAGTWTWHMATPKSQITYLLLDPRVIYCPWLSSWQLAATPKVGLWFFCFVYITVSSGTSAGIDLVSKSTTPHTPCTFPHRVIPVSSFLLAINVAVLYVPFTHIQYRRLQNQPLQWFDHLPANVVRKQLLRNILSHCDLTKSKSRVPPR